MAVLRRQLQIVVIIIIILRSAARLISHIPIYASVSAYICHTGFLSHNAFCIGLQHLSVSK